MKIQFFLILIVLVFAGCSKTMRVPYSTLVKEHPYYGPKIEAISEVKVIPLDNEAHVRLPGKVKAYAVNRYIDPANPRIMHERHVMYRAEEDPSWRLLSDEKKQILIGNTLTDGKLNYSPALMEKELAFELQRQRINNAALQNNSEILIDTATALSQENEILLERSEQLRQALIQQNKLNEELQNRLELRNMGRSSS